MSKLTSGMRISSYELLDPIGKTNMSEVWRARTVDGKIVALKTITPEAGSDPQLRQRFVREGLQKLEHPSIINILDFFEQQGDLYLIMQYISGGSLADKLDANPWKPLVIPEAMRISRQILLALDYAHRQLIVHRDVKPSNILLEGEQAFLCDFGIALSMTQPHLTTFKQVLGTRCYMSPEQIESSSSVTHLADVYSFGCVLYEMVTGRQPYPLSDKEVQYAVVYQRLHEPPVSPRQLNPAIPLRLEQVILTSLAPKPADRFPGCGSFARSLDGIENERPTDVTPPPGPPPPPPPPIVTKSVKRVSVAGNVIAAIVVGMLWIPFTGDSSNDTWQTMVFVGWILSNILLIRVLYKAWATLPSSHARTTPGKAVAFIFIPIYDLYWAWNILPGFASDYDAYMKQTNPVGRPAPRAYYVVFCIFHCYLRLILVLPILAYTSMILDNLLMTPIMIGIMAGAINHLSEAAEKQPAMAAGGKAVR